MSSVLNTLCVLRLALASSLSNAPCGRGLHSFPFQLNLSSSVHHMTRLSS